MPGIIRKIINLLCILRIYYVHTFLAIIKKILNLTNQCQQQWARLTFNYLKVKIKQLVGSSKLKEGRVMVYANHRSQADFFLHNVILNYQTNFLSRMAVLIASPAFIVSYRTVWFFNRGNRTQPEKFNEWLDTKFEHSPRPGLLVYPQGHRMQGVEKVNPQKIKTGMLKYAYRRKIPSQILITFGNEDILDQKKLHLQFNKNVCYKLSEVISPSDYETQNIYIEKIKGRFCELFDQVYEIYQKQKAEKIEQRSKNQ